MNRELRVDDLVANLLALAEVAQSLPAERLTLLMGYAPEAAALVADIDGMFAKLGNFAPGEAPQLPEEIWDQLREMCENKLKLLTGRIAVALYNVPGFRSAVRTWALLQPEKVSLSDESLAQRQAEAEPVPAGGAGGLGSLDETVLGRMRRLTALTQAALERPKEFAVWTDQLRWLAGWLKSAWPRLSSQP
ncbi:MAG TPA: hypothetical protein VJ183_20040 [Chloroflexia bacterium]|nr:hypothetical protein [Chloroflexia bacterium]